MIAVADLKVLSLDDEIIRYIDSLDYISEHKHIITFAENKHKVLDLTFDETLSSLAPEQLDTITDFIHKNGDRIYIVSHFITPRRAKAGDKEERIYMHYMRGGRLSLNSHGSKERVYDEHEGIAYEAESVNGTLRLLHLNEFYRKNEYNGTLSSAEIHYTFKLLTDENLVEGLPDELLGYIVYIENVYNGRRREFWE